MIKNIIFDFGGVIITLERAEAVRRFKALGIADADKQLDAYSQVGIFGNVENGSISDEDFRHQLSLMAGRELTWDECQWAWLGFRKDVPQRNIEILKRLRREGYRLIMLSNTNPFMMGWAMSSDFSRGLDADAPEGLPASSYFDAAYLSYEVGVMKPDAKFFEHVMSKEGLIPAETLFVDDGPKNCAAAQALGLHTFNPANGVDWTEELLKTLHLTI